MKTKPAAPKIMSKTSHLVSVVRERKGEAAPMTELCERIEKRLFRFCMFLTGEREMAKDLSQEVFIKVLENIHTLDNPERFVPWLFRVTKNRFLDHVRSAHYQRSTPSETAGEQLGFSAKTDLGLQLAGSLEKLSPEDRYLILLTSMEGLSYQECAEVLGVSADSVRCKLYRLRKSIRSDIHTMDFAA